MTFTELKAKVKDYCNLTSPEADARVGRSLNAEYRRITSSLGLDATRFVTRTASTVVNQAYATFTSIEKIDRALDVTHADALRLLREASMQELRSQQPVSGPPTRYAIRNTSADGITVLLDTLPDAVYSLQADGMTTLSDLSAAGEPAFPESFHDILVWFVIAEELLKKEKVDLAREYERRAERLLSDLRFALADSHTHTTRQRKTEALSDISALPRG